MVETFRRRTNETLGRGVQFDASFPSELQKQLEERRRIVDAFVSLGGAAGSPDSEGTAVEFFDTLTAYSAFVTMLSGKLQDCAGQTLVEFSNLKEAFAWERGFLAGALALPQRSLQTRTVSRARSAPPLSG